MLRTSGTKVCMLRLLPRRCCTFRAGSCSAVMLCAGGPEEYDAVKQWMMNMDPSRWHTIEQVVTNKPLAPRLLWVYKRA